MKIKRLNESIEFKPVVKQKDLPYYISSAEMIRFITLNSTMDWNKCCDYVRKYGICDGDGEDVTFWNKDDITEYNPEQLKWVTAFFEAHPFIEKMALVFDN